MQLARNTNFLALLLCTLGFLTNAEAIDREFLESKKCSNMFSYFEKKYHLPSDLLHSISLQETRKNHSTHNIGIVWPWTINVEGEGFYFKNKKDALIFAKTNLKKGKESIDVGCMQVNLKYHPKAFRSLEEALSPRHNIEYAAQLLSEYYTRYGSWSKAIGYYHSYTTNKADLYRTKVIKIGSQMASYKRDLLQYSRPTRKKQLDPNGFYFNHFIKKDHFNYSKPLFFKPNKRYNQNRALSYKK
jgi:hypothetical protein